MRRPQYQQHHQEPVADPGSTGSSDSEDAHLAPMQAAVIEGVMNAGPGSHAAPKHTIARQQPPQHSTQQQLNNHNGQGSSGRPATRCSSCSRDTQPSSEGGQKKRKLTREMQVSFLLHSLHHSSSCSIRHHSTTAVVLVVQDSRQLTAPMLAVALSAVSNSTSCTSHMVLVTILIPTVHPSCTLTQSMHNSQHCILGAHTIYTSPHTSSVPTIQYTDTWQHVSHHHPARPWPQLAPWARTVMMVRGSVTGAHPSPTPA